MLKTLGAQVKQYRWVTFITPVFAGAFVISNIVLRDCHVALLLAMTSRERLPF